MLQLTKLRTALQDLLAKPEKTSRAAAERWAAAYGAYAAEAQSCAGSPLLIPAAQQTLARTLEAVFATSTDLGTTIQKQALAFTAFWLTPPIIFSAVPPALPGAITVPPNPALLAGLLQAFMLPNLARAAGGRPPAISDVARQFAGALDVFTRAIVVTHVIPPGAPCVAPLT